MALVSHPEFPRPDLVAWGYPMTDWGLHIRAKTALAGYALGRLRVDCSEVHFLRGPEYRFRARNCFALEGVDGAFTTPDYIPEDAGRG